MMGMFTIILLLVVGIILPCIHQENNEKAIRETVKAELKAFWEDDE